MSFGDFQKYTVDYRLFSVFLVEIGFARLLFFIQLIKSSFFCQKPDAISITVLCDEPNLITVNCKATVFFYLFFFFFQNK